MPRRTASSAATTPAAKKGHKRGLSTPTAVDTLTPGTRSSKRIKAASDGTTSANSKTTPKKSKYFDGQASEDEDDNVEEDDPSVAEATDSGYEDEDEDTPATEPSEPPSESDDFDSEDEKPRKKKTSKSKGSTAQGTSSSTAMRDDLWKEGVKTGLGPGKQVFIAKPKPKGDGGIKYSPHKIHPNTMEFLKDLKNNNDREWLKLHDPYYRQSWNDWASFVESLTEKLMEVDETIPELPPKDVVFRIYRDVRFSKDPTPYKAQFSAVWSRTGRKGPFAGYYVQIKPGKNVVGCGLWSPEASALALIRRNIDRRPEQLKNVLMDAGIRKLLFGGIPKDEKKAVKAFTGQNAEGALKSKPKGFNADHPDIELLRLRSFTIGTTLKDADVLSPGYIDKVTEIFQAMHPFVTFLNSVVMPDEDDEGSEDGDDDDDDNDDESSNSENE